MHYHGFPLAALTHISHPSVVVGLVPEQKDHAEPAAHQFVHLGHGWAGALSRVGPYLLPVVGRRHSGVRHNGPGLFPEGQKLGA